MIHYNGRRIDWPKNKKSKKIEKKVLTNGGGSGNLTKLSGGAAAGGLKGLRRRSLEKTRDRKSRKKVLDKRFEMV